MKKLFIITLLFLVQSVPSFGNPNGKGIICQCIEVECILKKSGHYFSKNKVKVYYFKKEKDQIVIENRESDTYSVTSREIRWTYYDTGMYILNRKNLKLKIDFPGFNKQYYYQCNLYKGFHFNREINKLKRLYQIEYNKKLKDNKI